jgi:predicted phosphodiesterase
MKFGATADWHIGSKTHYKDKLQKALKILYNDEGIKDVYHSGDMIDGFGVYHGQLNNLRVWEEEGQLDLAAETISPWEDKLEFYGVYGNHDYSYVKQSGTNPLRDLEKRCPNYHLLGTKYGKYPFMSRKGVDHKVLELVHANTYGKTPGFPQEAYLRERAKADNDDLPVPDILLMGHLHRYDPLDCYGCRAFLVGNFQGPNDFTIRRGMISPPGLYVIEIDDEGRVIPKKILV